MKQALFFIILSMMITSCNSQESIILEKKKINWKNNSFLFSDNSKTTFKPKLEVLSHSDMFEITYLSDGLKIQAYAAVPKKPGKYPVIIFNRGGNRNFGALQLFRDKWKYAVTLPFSKLASNGYIVIGCNYRGSGDSEGMEEFGGKDVNDVLNLISVVNEFPKADTTKIGMYGWSRGAMMTYLALTKTSKIKAAIAGGGRSDLTIIDRPEMEQGVYAELIPNYYQNKEQELKNRSAIFWAEKFSKNVPILLLHGNADWRVKSTNSLRLALEFEKHRIPYRLKIYEGADHGITQFRKEKNNDVISWFDTYLKGNNKINMDFKGN